MSNPITNANIPTIPDWHSRGYLPHVENKQLQMVTFRLYDSIPKAILNKWKENVIAESNIDVINKLQNQIMEYDDNGYGCCFLKIFSIARLSEYTLLRDDGSEYDLIRWCIMPNHIHTLINVKQGHTVYGIVQKWKPVIAHKANTILNRHGRFWMPEYHDRYIRDDNHLSKAVQYIDNNPVKAGLAQLPTDWRWSSAGYLDFISRTH